MNNVRTASICNHSRQTQEGSLFGHGYDPVTGDFKGAVSQLTYTGSRGNDTFLNDWVHPTLNSVHTLPDQVRLYALDLGARRKPQIILFFLFGLFWFCFGLFSFVLFSFVFFCLVLPCFALFCLVLPCFVSLCSVLSLPLMFCFRH